MNHFYIIVNENKDQDLRVTNAISHYLHERGKKCTVRSEKPDMNGGGGHVSPEEIPVDVDCVIVLGGDGTLIRAARDVNERQLPLFGINLGTLGYLSETDESGIYPAIDSIIEGNYEIERRMMLEGRIFHGNHVISKNVALNDVVIGREGRIHVVSLINYVNGKYLNNYRADGVIISTPTGSTGYSLSAGGPIISPNAFLFLMTPLAAHTLNTRSIVFPSENVITVEIGQGRERTVDHAVASFDGDPAVPMETGDRAEIRRAERDTLLIRTRNDSFLETLRRKMSNR